MSSETDLIVIDDDEDEDRVDIIDADAFEESSQVEAVQECRNQGGGQNTSKKQVRPKNICGYTKPSLSYPILIATALASSPFHQATAVNICNKIEETYPYYKVCPFNWKQSVYTALMRRKKCFVIVDTNQEGEYIWSYNPLFEKYMLENWVPKYKQVAKSGRQSSGSEVHQSQASTVEDRVQFSTEVPGLFLDCEPAPTEARPLPREVESHYIDSVGNTKEDLPSDFLPGNACHSRISLSKLEAQYRQKFQAEHPKVEKFRLHCTVCDIHLGTAGKSAETNVRFHSRLGVLTCASCYSRTINLCRTTLVCLWCNSFDKKEGYVYCCECSAKFCTVCVRRNFGEMWLNRIVGKTDWQCFFCDMKQIWPHRAIAYSLYIHYSDLRRIKKLYVISKDNQQQQAFYLKDKSTCCKIDLGTILKSSTQSTSGRHCKQTESVASRVSSLSSHLPSKSNVFVPSQKQTLVIEERSPNRFFVPSSEGGPYVTVNTGTQYIHNIYPENNFTIVQPSQGGFPRTFPPTQTTIVPPTQTTIVPPAQTTIVPPTHTVIVPPTTQINETTTNQRQRTPQLFSDSQNTNSLCQPSSQQISYTSHFSSDIVTEFIVDNSFESFPENECAQDPLDPIPDSTFRSENNLLVSNYSESDLVISKNNLKDKNLPSIKNVFSFKTEHDKIKRKPMPKSKKLSLLRSLLDREQVEVSTENEHNDSLPSCTVVPNVPEQVDDVRGNSNSSLSLESIHTIKPNQGTTCVGIESNLRSDHLQNSNYPTDNGSVETITSNELLKKENQNTVTNNIPKIKVRTLEELQEHKDVNKYLTPGNVLAIEVDKEQHHDEVDCEVTKVDVTSLKQGIIEGSRTLVTTQRKFKELARTISSQVLYDTKTAKNMIKRFQEILKLCKKQIEDVDSNIAKQYNHLFQNMDIGSLLKSIRLENEENTKKQVKNVKSTLDCHKQQRGFNDIEEDEGNRETIEENSLNTKNTLKRKRKAVDFNPLGKKSIIGTPDVTQADVDLMNNSNLTGVSDPCDLFIRELKSKQLNLRKKKEIWSYKKRSKWCHKKKYNSSTYKTKKQRRRRKNFGDLDSDDEGTPSSCYYKAAGSHVRCTTRLKPPSIPMRISKRNHPSTACLGILPLSGTSTLHQTFNIKPCSVMLHRLDPRVVQLLEMRFHEV